MHSMSTNTRLLTIVLLAWLRIKTKKGKRDMREKQAEQLNQFIADYCKKTDFSGALRVTLKDEILYEAFIGKADYENNIPITKDSIFTFYSLSKPFCAIGLLLLKDKGLVDIDAHPSKYVPEMRGFDQRVTIRHMLHHVSGMPDFEQTKEFFNKYQYGPVSKVREHMKLLSEYPMCFSPGTGAMYANVNFVASALIIENVSGMKYADYMKEFVFEPLGMKNAQVDCEDLMVPNRVKGYEQSQSGLRYVPKSYKWLLGAGDIIGTIDDVYGLNKAIKHKLLLNPETWQEVLTPSPLNSMGMGCCVTGWYGKQRIQHNGGHTGFRTLHIQLPEDDFDIILLSNCGFGDARNDFADAIHEIYYGAGGTNSDIVEMDKGYI